MWPDFPYGTPPPPHVSEEEAKTDEQGQASIECRAYRRCGFTIHSPAFGDTHFSLEGLGQDEARIAFVKTWELKVARFSEPGPSDVRMRQTEAFIFNTTDIIQIPVIIGPQDWSEKSRHLENTRGMLLPSWKPHWNETMRCWSCRSMDSFYLIPWLGDVCRDRPSLHPEVLASLGNICKTLWELTEILQGLSKSHKNQPKLYPTEAIATLRKWTRNSGDDSTSFDEIMERAQARIQTHALEAIEVLKPFLADHDEAIAALGELRALGRPAIPHLQPLLGLATPRRRMLLLSALYDVRPTWRDVDWFVRNDDPAIALAGYHAAAKSMALADVPEALESVRKFKETLKDPRMQDDARHVINGLEYRLKFKQ